ncbi:hypothetical protein GHT06_016605 [Daphnia sinensis]|uniref:Transcriptional regulatory protein n=1 Tax=Daphnia sinensis TaxID=1820382 RepID=A0AAD5PU53_9CRUS|nr:hypothetical protein GHT06_016605 [Daphnia sinensis]
MFKKSHLSFLLSLSRNMAGHSKWANIKHIKGAKDAERANLHMKLFRQIKAVIKEQGSSDPKQNIKLAHLVEQARQHNVPVEKVQQVLKSAAQSQEDLKQYILEVRGPKGTFFVIEVLSTSYLKAKQGINTINRKFNGSWADGVSNNLFNHKGLIKVVPLSQGQTLEQVLDDAINIGAEDVTAEEDGNFVFTCSPRDFFNIRRAINQLGYNIIESDLHYIPLSRVQIESEEDIAAVTKLYNKLEEEPDVVRIHDNIE